jgi:hypothetical protein
MLQVRSQQAKEGPQLLSKTRLEMQRELRLHKGNPL